MEKRFLSFVLVLVLSCSMVCGGCAEVESITFEPMLLPTLSAFDSAGTAVQSSNRTFAAAALYMEYIFHQMSDEKDADNRAAWKDCVIARKESAVAAAYDADDVILLIIYDTINEKVEVGEINGIFSLVTQVFENEEYSSIHTIDGDEWTDMLQQMLQVVIEALDE